MKLQTGILALALSTLVPASASAQAAAASWVGKSVVISNVGRRMAPACPGRAQAEHYHKVKSLKFDKAAVGCVVMRSGNFDSATVVADSGEYVKVNFMRKKANRDKVLWVPRSAISLAP
jgi:hypothetical protein